MNIIELNKGDLISFKCEYIRDFRLMGINGSYGEDITIECKVKKVINNIAVLEGINRNGQKHYQYYTLKKAQELGFKIDNKTVFEQKYAEISINDKFEFTITDKKVKDIKLLRSKLYNLNIEKAYHKANLNCENDDCIDIALSSYKFFRECSSEVYENAYWELSERLGFSEY